MSGMVKHPIFGIIGYGMAGKSAAIHLRTNFPNAEIHIFDKDFSVLDDRVWCSWVSGNSPIPGAVSHHWETMLVKGADSNEITISEPWRYEMVTPKSLHHEAMKQLSVSGRVFYHPGRIHNFTESANSVIIEGDFGMQEVDFAIQSIRNKNAKKPLKYPLIQHFLGWEVESKKSIFSPDCATIMDFNVPDQSTCNFIYVLPFSRKEALIESTYFSPTPLDPNVYEENIRSWLAEKYPKLNIDNFSIKRIEKGEIRMDDDEFEPVTPRILPLGMVGTQTKPSTGYTFYYVQKELQRQCGNLKKNHNFLERKRTRFRTYDLVLLDFLLHNPDKANAMFFNLFRKNGIDRVLSFLNEETNFGEEVLIMNSTPRLRFLSSLWRSKNV